MSKIIKGCFTGGRAKNHSATLFDKWIHNICLSIYGIQFIFTSRTCILELPPRYRLWRILHNPIHERNDNLNTGFKQLVFGVSRGVLGFKSNTDPFYRDKSCQIYPRQKTSVDWRGYQHANLILTLFLFLSLSF